MEKLYKWLLVVIGFLLIPPVNWFIDGFFQGFFGRDDTIGTTMWIVSIIILAIGVKELISKKK